jgi:hypothetical protein
VPGNIQFGAVVVTTGIFGGTLGAVSCSLAASRGALWLRGGLLGGAVAAGVALAVVPEAEAYFSQNPNRARWATLVGMTAALVIAVAAGIITGSLCRRAPSPPPPAQPAAPAPKVSPEPPTPATSFSPLGPVTDDSWSGQHRLPP